MATLPHGECGAVVVCAAHADGSEAGAGKANERVHVRRAAPTGRRVRPLPGYGRMGGAFRADEGARCPALEWRAKKNRPKRIPSGGRVAPPFSSSPDCITQYECNAEPSHSCRMLWRIPTVPCCRTTSACYSGTPSAPTTHSYTAIWWPERIRNRNT